MIDDPKFNQFLIKEYKYWKVYIHQNQSLLGRVYLWSKRDEAVDFLEMTEQEKQEFFEVARNLKESLVKLFQPDLFNYASLGNETQHLHIHLMPRYKSDREFEGIKFSDKRWGGVYSPGDKAEISEELLFKIRDKIKEKLSS